jgi:NitT/TauT family transport system ATP-binding protein
MMTVMLRKGRGDGLAGDAPRLAPEPAGAELPRLSFHQMCLTFPDGTEAVRNVDLEVRRGEFVSLIGPSGCGKSTLLRIASGLLEQTSGEVRCDRADIGYVFQDPTLLPWRTVEENVQLFAELHGLPKNERKARTAEVLELVGLTGSEAKFPKALSGGMRSRVSMARSLLLHPSLFLFDEPFAAIDEINRERLNDSLLKLFGIEKFAGVFVTHSIAEACFLASRVVVMTSRPAQVSAIVDVPFPYPRTADLRYDKEFVEITKHVSSLLLDSHLGNRQEAGRS